jgi:hypothetical protein
MLLGVTVSHAETYIGKPVFALLSAIMALMQKKRQLGAKSIPQGLKADSLGWTDCRG